MNTLFDTLLLGMPGPLELVLILLVVLLVVGPKKLPDLMRAIGQSISSLKKGMREGEEEAKKLDTDEKNDKPGGQAG